MIAEMVADRTTYDCEEDSIIQCCLAMLAADSAGKARHFKSGPTVDSSSTRLAEDSGLLVGNTQLVIRGASPLDIIAYLMDVKSRINESRLDPLTDVRLEIREVRNVHHIITFYEGKIAPFRNRTFLNASVWKKLSDMQCVWCTSPIASHPSVTPSDESHAVRAETVRCIRLTFIAEGVTKIEYACSVDLKGHFPTWVTNSKIIPTLMHTPYTLQEYFAQIRPIDDCAAPDVVLIGHMLMNAEQQASKRHRAEAVAAFISRTAMLRDAPLAHLDTMLQSLICSRGLRVLAGAAATQDPAQLMAAEADIIGEGIMSIIRSQMMPAKAIAEVLDRYPVLRSTAQHCAWFEPMLAATIARRMAISIGKKLRLGFSTTLSLLDVGSDVATMLIYFLSEQFLTASLILTMVCVSIAAQALLVFYRNQHRSTVEIAKEMLILLSFFKPVVDLRRLMDGHEVDGAPFDTATERGICKVIETVCERSPPRSSRWSRCCWVDTGRGRRSSRS
jgi:hypothetical protein